MLKMKKSLVQIASNPFFHCTSKKPETQVSGNRSVTNNMLSISNKQRLKYSRKPPTEFFTRRKILQECVIGGDGVKFLCGIYVHYKVNSCSKIQKKCNFVKFYCIVKLYCILQTLLNSIF